MDSQDSNPMPLPGHGPPPSYDQVIAYDELISRQQQQQQQLYYKNTHLNHNHVDNYCVFASTATTTPQTMNDTTDIITTTSAEIKYTNPNIKCDNEWSDGALSEDSIDHHQNNNHHHQYNQHQKENSTISYMDTSELQSSLFHTNLCQYCGKSIINSNLFTINSDNKCRCKNITMSMNNMLCNSSGNSDNIYNNNNNNLNGDIYETSTVVSDELNENEINYNLPSTSANYNCQHQFTNHQDYNNLNSNDISFDNINNDSDSNNNSNNENNNYNIDIDFDNINENGIIRLDMSQIIDSTGLPTYEAALKLESSGYV